MRNCLVVCATNENTACQAAAQVANSLRTRGVVVDLECGNDVADLDGYDTVVIGAPLGHRRWQRAARKFVRRHRELLESKDIAVFVSSPDVNASSYDRAWDRIIKTLTRLGWLDPVRIEILPEPPDPRCCETGDASRIDRWSQNLSVALHLPDSDGPQDGGVI